VNPKLLVRHRLECFFEQ